jgi:metallo-beta-lactamase class B
MKRHLTVALAVLTAAAIAGGISQAQPADTIDQHLKAARKAAGLDWPGTLSSLCVAPANAPPPDRKPGPPPADRARWYTEPAKVFDDVYFVGTKDRSSRVLPTPE